MEVEVKRLHVYASILELKLSLDVLFKQKLRDPISGTEVKMYLRKTSINSEDYIVTAKKELSKLKEIHEQDVGSIRFSLIENEPKNISLIEISLYKPNNDLFFKENDYMRRIVFYFANKFSLQYENERPQLPEINITEVDLSLFGIESTSEDDGDESENSIEPVGIESSKDKNENPLGYSKDLPEHIYSTNIEDYLVLRDKEIMKKFYPSYNYEDMISLIKAIRKTYEIYVSTKNGRWGPGKFNFEKHKAETRSRYFGALYNLGVRFIDEAPIPYISRKRAKTNFANSADK